MVNNKEEFEKAISDLDALWLTLDGEARGEPIEGIIAVGCVIRNRVNEQKKTYKDVCLAHLQFSAWNDGDPNLLEMMSSYNFSVDQAGKAQTKDMLQLQYIAKGILTNQILDNTFGSNHYLTVKLYHSVDCPLWAKAANLLTIIGHQYFLKAA
jgi:N-acetylmuramoyl-L-alanine amidase